MKFFTTFIAIICLTFTACSKFQNNNPDSNIKILGADISWLPQFEDEQKLFTDKSQTKDVLSILKDHGFNYIRLRLFVNPSNPKGYSPNKNYCDLPQTMNMIKRAKTYGYKVLLDFHYSDTWADPGKQFIPLRWTNLSTKILIDSLQNYTYNTMQTLKLNNCLPDMVQIGNEINHGFLWKQGSIDSLDNLANLLKAGIQGIRLVDETIPIMLHIALGGLNGESKYFLDNMISRGVVFDIIGQSYYPRYHGTIQDLSSNLFDLINHYKKPIIVVEYSKLKQSVNDIAFSLPASKYMGTFIWEPLNNWGEDA